MTVLVNGEPITCVEAWTVEELIGHLRLSRETTLVERNGEALRRREWPAIRLSENDRLELLQVAAGG